MARQKANNPETIDLTDVLAREVKVEIPQAVIMEPDEVEEIQEIEFEEDFKQPVTKNAEYVHQSEPGNDGPGYQESGQSFMSPQDIAENIVNLLDGLQSSIIPYLREKKIFSEKELEHLAKLDKTARYDSNSKEFSLLQKWQRHQDIIKSIPFDEGEARRLKSATARYTETTDMQVTPFQGLMMAYSEVIIKRVSVFMQD